MLPPVEAFIHHSISAVTFVFNLTKNPVGFSIANGKSIIKHIQFPFLLFHSTPKRARSQALIYDILSSFHHDVQGMLRNQHQDIHL
jgi:hypothetical protein